MVPAVKQVASAVIAASLAVGCGAIIGIPDVPDVSDASIQTGDASGDARQTTPAVSSKIDILFMIDNSAAMGDKQKYLGDAIPDLITGLMQPGGTAVPVHDMHIGVVTSSLGSRGGDLCLPMAMDGTLNAHNDDKGELINRSGDDEAPVPDMTTSNFLAWFPSVSANMDADAGVTPTITSATTLESDFSDLISGVHQGGCGIESQLESWYRFLIQPDPYDSIAVNGGAASWVNVDTTILQQRHDFLRPDSAVLIVDLTDENDSEIDVRSLGQQGYNWMVSTFQPPRGTMACLTNPGDPNCTSCAINGSDPNCSNGPYTASNDWGFNANLRHVHMKAKYGLDLQFPINRYVNGLTSGIVPDRDGEYPTNSSGGMATNYVGNNDCTNPLFAATLPDGSMVDKATLCNLPTGTRSTSLIFYAHIGGVPYQLLHFTPGNSAASALTAADWVKILGNGPETYDYSGIDPHMIESYQPRAGLPDPTSADNADPESGREWTTDTNPANNGNFVDLEFACTFPLTTPRDCTLAANAASCDCPTTAGTTWEHGYTPPLCGGAGSLNTGVPQTTQIAAKAYPTIRETELVDLMGAQGVLGSVCPILVTDNAEGDDPTYGYRPAVAEIIAKLAPVLTE
jgi:hypothetical protein